MRVIGLGTQDSPGEAEEFVESYGTYSFPVYWDETFESWAEFGVSGQPAAMVFTPAGEFITGWYGMFPEDEVLELAAEHNT